MENCFRACDINYDSKVTNEELFNFLKKLKMKIPERKLMRFIEILDENYSGFIEREEFYETLEAYGLATEDHKSQVITYKNKVIKTYQERCQKMNLSISDVFYSCANGTQAESKELGKNMKNMLKLLDKEIHFLIRMLDPSESGIISFHSYLACLEKNIVSASFYNRKIDENSEETTVKGNYEQFEEIDKDSGEEEMNYQENPKIQQQKDIKTRKDEEKPKPDNQILVKSPQKQENFEVFPSAIKFIELLKSYSLDPIGVFRFSNKANADSISIQDFFHGLKKLITNLEERLTIQELQALFPDEITKDLITKISVYSNNKTDDLNTHEY